MNEDELAAFLEAGAFAGAHDGDGRPGEPPSSGAAEDLRALLADATLWAEPAPGGADALLAAISAEQPPQPGGSQAPFPLATGRGGGRGRRRLGQPTGWRLVAAAAAVALVAGVAGVVVVGGGDEPGGQEFAIAGTDLAPAAGAVATVETLGSGAAIALDVHDLPPAPPGTYYQAWVKGPDGLVTVGTFHMRAGDAQVELWAGVDLELYPTLTVTLQQEGGGPESSGEVVLTGDIRP